MKQKSIFKSMFTLALSLALMLSLAVTASAASITIDGNGQAGMGGAGRFKAYQIFKGNLGNTGADRGKLVGITWGSGVDSDKLVAALKESDLPVTADGGSGKFGEKFTAAWNAWESKHEDSVSEAELVAQFLAQHLTDREYADDFARIVAGYTKGDGTVSGLTSDKDGWVIDSLENGYYLVKDTYTTPTTGDKPDGAVSSYILQVSGNARVSIKSSLPTVTKKVEEQDGYLSETNKELTFTLTGTVAENIGEYKKYYYKFTDTLSAGLSCDSLSDANITVEIDEQLLTRGTDYTAELNDGDEGRHILTVEFADLKESAQKAGVTLNPNTKIVVTYKAKLNDSAVIGKTGNPNDVTLTYSNDPYSEGKGESVTDEVKTYTLGLDIVKQNDEKEPEPLQDAKFKLKNDEDMYAKMNEQEAEDGKATYIIVGWGAEADGTEMVTNEEGTFSIHGFAAGKYTIVETQAPDGYEKMKDIVFNITGEIDGTGELIKAGLVRDEENLKRQDVALGGSMLDGNGKLTLTNYKAPILPNTGGIGAKIVYVVSGLAVLIGVCVVLMALRKRKGE